jgi:hypothetical protein
MMTGHEPMCPVCATLIVDGDEVLLMKDRPVHAVCLLQAVSLAQRKGEVPTQEAA